MDEKTILDPVPREAWANELHGYGTIMMFFETKQEAEEAFRKDSRSDRDKCAIHFREVL